MKDNLSKIKIIKEIPFFGNGDTIENRLRKVSLRGFTDVNIYKNSNFEIKKLSSEEIKTKLHIPQPHVIQDNLDRIQILARLFREKDIDIFHLEKAYDYIAYSESGEETEWTIMPPVVEKFNISKHAKGGFDYSNLIGPQLRESMLKNGWKTNEVIEETSHDNESKPFSLINDGSHRVHAGLETGNGVTVLEISSMAPGFPYYAIPQKYSSVKVFPTEESAPDLKIHILTSPGHKQLYRLFPSGGIMSGTVRAAKGTEKFV